MQGQVFSQRRFFDRIKQSLASLLVGLMAMLKFAPILLKTGGTMFITIFLYAGIFGWTYAAGFVLLIFVHETGHLIAARMMGLKVGWPVFIPFMGALIALKEAPRNAWVEAVVGIGGPILGSVGAVAVWGIYYLTGNYIYLALAAAGALINLFNLIPMVPLDGGRIVTAISPWFWLLGLAVLVPILFYSANILLILILFLLMMNSFPRVIALFRKRTDVEQRYYECTPAQRWIISILYVALIAGLGLMMHSTERQMPANFRVHGAYGSNGTDSQ